jgi:hypothetical protein
MAESSPRADLPAALVAYLRDEANLSTARQVLDDAHHDCLARQETVRAQRPTLGFLAGKKQRDDYAAGLAAVNAQLEAIDAMLGRVTLARERLEPHLRASLISYLSASDSLYIQGLRAGRFHEHWLRLHGTVSDRVRAFLRDLREIRNAVAADAQAGRARHSTDSAWRIDNARTAAAELEREIDNLNHTAADHAATIFGTPFGETRLPVVEKWDCIARVDTLKGRSPTDTLADVDRLITDYIELKQPSLETLLAMYNAANGEHVQVMERQLRTRWSELLEYAETHWVADAELEPTLAAIERRQSETERARLAAQIPNKPFSHER